MIRTIRNARRLRLLIAAALFLAAFFCTPALALTYHPEDVAALKRIYDDNESVRLNVFGGAEPNQNTDWTAAGVTWSDTTAENRRVLEIEWNNKALDGTLDFAGLPQLSELWCNYNQLIKLDVSKNTALTMFDCGYNQLTELDVSKNTDLTRLNCEYSQLAELDVSKNTDLMNLYCHYNQLTKLGVSKNTDLIRLNCEFNQLTALDVSKNTTLTDLYCGSNQLTELDVSKNTGLMNLDCHSNQLTELDVSKNTGLSYLDCGSNQLTELDLSANTALSGARALSNPIETASLAPSTNNVNNVDNVTAKFSYRPGAALVLTLPAGTAVADKTLSDGIAFTDNRDGTYSLADSGAPFTGPSFRRAEIVFANAAYFITAEVTFTDAPATLAFEQNKLILQPGGEASARLLLEPADYPLYLFYRLHGDNNVDVKYDTDETRLNPRITARYTGKTVLSAYTEDYGAFAYCDVIVSGPVSGVTVDRSELTLAVGDTARLTASVASADSGNPAYYGAAWTSSDESIATVDSDGTVTALAPGTTAITATAEADDSKTATTRLTVTGGSGDHGSSSGCKAAAFLPLLALGAVLRRRQVR